MLSYQSPEYSCISQPTSSYSRPPMLPYLGGPPSRGLLLGLGELSFSFSIGFSSSVSMSFPALLSVFCFFNDGPKALEPGVGFRFLPQRSAASLSLAFVGFTVAAFFASTLLVGFGRPGFLPGFLFSDSSPSSLSAFLNPRTSARTDSWTV